MSSGPTPPSTGPARARRGLVALASALGVLTALLAACGSPSGQAGRPAGDPPRSYTVPAGIHKIKHVIIVMQENRSFDHYFGTYPGAAGIPMRHGKPTVCRSPPSFCIDSGFTAATVSGAG